MAGDVVSMSPTAQIMIHNVWTYAEGDYRDMRKEAEVLESHNESVANAYILKTGKSKEELLSMMDKETWMNAREAKEAGFIDEIMFDKDNKIAASLKSYMIPGEIMDKVRNLLQQGKVSTKTDAAESDNINLLKNKIKLLNLKEVKGYE
jgi:deoxyhypusine synthase